MKSTIKTLLLSVLPLLAQAQYKSEGWDQTFRQSGKIYVVVAVITLILLVLIGYLITQDRRISRIEKELKNHED